MLPEGYEEARQLDRDVVHHQRKERFVCTPLRLEHRGNAAPDAARNRAAEEHDDHQRNQRKRIAKVDHASRGNDTANQHLTFCADVPKAHLERRSKADRDTEQHHDVANRHPNALLGAKRTVKHGRVDLDRVQLRQSEDDDGADDQCHRKADQANAKRFPDR